MRLRDPRRGVLSCAAAVSVMGKRVWEGAAWSIYHDVRFGFCVCGCGCVGYCWSSVKRRANAHANKPENL